MTGPQTRPGAKPYGALLDDPAVAAGVRSSFLARVPAASLLQLRSATDPTPADSECSRSQGVGDSARRARGRRYCRQDVVALEEAAGRWRRTEHSVFRPVIR